jgi:2,4-dienoyl-CoA reductase-like NADH-dependent reductase (Old Yellow Enzyme family)
MEEEAYFLPAAKKIASLVDIPIILVGGMRSRAVMNAVLRDGYADFISIARPLIREPNLPNKFERGVSEEATCVSCNRCLAEMSKGNPLRCYYTG